MGSCVGKRRSGGERILGGCRRDEARKDPRGEVGMLLYLAIPG
jgi:hypothetical protein